MLPTLVFEGRKYSPAWLQAQIERVQAGLHGLGCREGDTVAAMLRNAPEYVALVMACRLGGVYLASINWHFKAQEARHILVDSGARALFVHDDLVAQIASGLPDGLPLVAVPSGRAASLPAYAQAWSDFGEGLPAMPPRQMINFGTITYTSGTTGVPKGVRRIAPPAHLRDGMDERLYRMTDTVYGHAQHPVAYLSAPIYHSASMTFLAHFCRLGARIVLESGFDAERALGLIESERVTHAYLVPTMYQRLLALDPALRTGRDLSALRHVASTGSPCPPALKQAMIEWFGPVITEAYGSSEAGYTTFIDSHNWLRRPGSAGRALPDATVRILDEQGAAVPPGSMGLIYVRQHAQTDFSYVNKPEARQAIERDGLVTLGDMGYLDEDGFLFICDRKSDMVISGGVNIYPAEIESVLITMPGVADCAVFGIPDAEFGEAIGAAIQPAAGSSLAPAAVQAWLRERIANYKVPRSVEFHAELPREDTGKIFKRRLREPHWRGQQRAI